MTSPLLSRQWTFVARTTLTTPKGVRGQEEKWSILSCVIIITFAVRHKSTETPNHQGKGSIQCVDKFIFLGEAQTIIMLKPTTYTCPCSSLTARGRGRGRERQETRKSWDSHTLDRDYTVSWFLLRHDLFRNWVTQVPPD